MKFKSLLVVSYQRSSANLLQSLLNTLPNVSIKGETFNFFWGLYLSYKSLNSTKNPIAQVDPTQNGIHWSKTEQLDLKLYTQQLQSVILKQFRIEGLSTCLGFKEIEYLRRLDELHQYLDFLSTLLPNLGIIFITRLHDPVLKSSFWKQRKPEDAKNILDKADRLFLDYAEKHEHSFLLRYERLILGSSSLEPLFRFLECEVDFEKVNDSLRKIIGYKPEENLLEDVKAIMEPKLQESFQSDSKKNLTRLDQTHKPDLASEKLVVFSVVKNEADRLPFFLHYYRNLDCKRFVIIDNDSTDGTSDYLKQQSDVVLYQAPSDLYSQSKSGRDWFNTLTKRHVRVGGWALAVDADELIAWPGSEGEKLTDLVSRAERMGLNRIFTPMIDVYPDTPCDELQPYITGQPFNKVARYFDAIDYAEALWSRNRLVVYSGPRMRFKTENSRPPIMSKQSLYMVEPDGYQHIGSHFDCYGTPSPLVAALLHYKFMPDFQARVSEAVSQRNHWNNSIEYQSYAAVTLWSQPLIFEGSVELRDSSDLARYISVLTGIIRSEGLCGSRHLEKKLLF